MSTATARRRTTILPLRAVVALSATLLLVTSVGVSTASGGTSEPDAQGYWYRNPAVAAQDSSVPDGGLVVAGQPEGPLAVSALRFSVPSDERAASIHLTVDSDTREGFIEEPLLFACPAEEAWEPTEAGDWEDVPGTHCSPGSSSEGEVDEEEGTYVFTVSQFIQNGTVDVIITPGTRGAVPSPLLLQDLNDQLIEQIGTGAPWPGPPTLDGANGSNFRVTFEAPGGDAVRTGSDSADESVTALEFESDNEFDNDFDDSGSEDDFESDAGGGGAPSATADPPDTSGSSAPTGSGADMGDAPQPQTADPPQGADNGGEEPVQGTPPGEPDTEAPVALEEEQAGGVGGAEPAGTGLGFDPRLLGALVLALAALGAGALTMGSDALGRRPQSALGGLAQFARPRAGPPPRL